MQHLVDFTHQVALSIGVQVAELIKTQDGLIGFALKISVIYVVTFFKRSEVLISIAICL